MFLSRAAKHVHVLVRGDALADSMSAYLSNRLEQDGKITVHFGTGEAFSGGYYLASDDDTIQDSDTGDVVHDVTLSPNDTTIVELRPDTRANYAATDRIEFVDAGGTFYEDPDVDLYRFTTNNDSVTDVEDLRPTQFVLGPEATEALAGDSLKLGGAGADQYARSDIPERFQSSVGFGPEANIRGDIGSATNERQRLAGGFGDTVVQTGTDAGRFTQALNAEFQSSDDTWRIINGDDNAAVFGLNVGNPGINYGASVTFAFFVTDETVSDGDAFTWDTVTTTDNNAAPLVNGERGLSVPRRSAAPPGSAVPDGTELLWIDSDTEALRSTDSAGDTTTY